MQTLTTDRLELVPLDPARDAVALHALLSDPEVHAYGEENATKDVHETEARLEKDVAGNGGLTWVIRLRGTEQALGWAGVFYDQGTTIRGLSWYLRRDHWGRGITSEAARAVVDHLLAQPNIDGVEAWIDTRNLASIGVARRAGLDEVSRMPRVYADHLAQQVVMARAAEPRDPEVLAVRPMLSVRNSKATASALCGVLGLRVEFEHDTYIRLAARPWTASVGLDLVEEDKAFATVIVGIGSSVDECYQRAQDQGIETESPPEDMPWYRREFTMVLDGNFIRVSGPTRP
ncbi:GNAT family N-acetyltransferase [Tenggerimyces flavus]|uniref:GNAT family N-acetyltransferase n=1 Tax=Tenggerimyces flavus TaxID=1708749 RepID=A0ABV7YL42_9ACTN|nr:GNAT family N-acetyltransferase [Tenggerimyces flavus]MBM7784923.1 RimJ/RimL family protein N-acetyltransferase/uncharacterized glyoxalase superfamily protein PhnB [Tenggerimyces flavus]